LKVAAVWTASQAIVDLFEAIIILIDICWLIATYFATSVAGHIAVLGQIAVCLRRIFILIATYFFELPSI